MTYVREQVIYRALVGWAERLDVPVTVRELAALAVEVDRELRWLEPRLYPVRPVLKAGATADDARRIAARLEASFKGAQP